MVKNYVEVFVDELLADMLSKKDILPCACESCLDSIRAITLNHMKPFYITHRAGEVFGEYRNKETQYRADILTELARAIEIVAKNPKHSETL